MEQSLEPRVTLVVLKQHVKTVKQALERTGQLDRSGKITPHLQEGEEHSSDYAFPAVLQDRSQCGEHVAICQDSSPTAETSSESSVQATLPLSQYDAARAEHIKSTQTSVGEEKRGRRKEQRMCVPTTIPYPVQTEGSACMLHAEMMEELKLDILQQLALSTLSGDISVSQHFPAITSPLQQIHQNPVHKALGKALTSVVSQLALSHGLTVEALVSAFPDGYLVYKPMLLLPHNVFSSAPWTSLIGMNPVDCVAMRTVWQTVAEVLGVTHIAINSPIPQSTTSTSALPANATSNENILRRPVNLIPLHGDFGTTPTQQTIASPTTADFDNALWVTARQNGIWQTWAPLYTMFSRGNIREKTRILHSPSVTTGLDAASTAVDLYGGIGYFAFSYRKSSEGVDKGIKQVVCWEINPWSVEGLRRGADMNGWTCRVLQQEDVMRLQEMDPVDALSFHDTDFIVFQKSNEGADLDFSSLPSPKLPVRHVNLGLLPSSKLSWHVAVAMLDTKQGGWIHVHENVATQDIKTMQREVESKFQDLVTATDGMHGRRVSLDHVERVKMYAPGVVHCVFDVWVEGRNHLPDCSLHCYSR